MNTFDLTIIKAFNRFAQHSLAFDEGINFISDCALIKTGIIILLIWYYWFKDTPTRIERRQQIVSIILSSSIAIFIARLLSMSLPFRPRPINNPGLELIVPHGMVATDFDSLSSFPSDHAVFVYVLAVGIFYLSRRWGLFALIYVSLFVALPRIYLGLHYPTDILAGAFLGVAVAVAGNSERIKEIISRPILNWEKTIPGFFYAAFFLITSQMADMFGGSRAIIKALIRAAKYLLS